MKSIALAFAATLFAVPALADCATDLQEQSNKVSAATQEVSAAAQGSLEQQCSTNGVLLDETKKLVDLYETCQSDLGLTDEQIAQMRQQIDAAETNYNAQCG